MSTNLHDLIVSEEQLAEEFGEKEIPLNGNTVDEQLPLEEVTEELGEDLSCESSEPEQEPVEVEFIETEHLESIVESILFASDRPVSLGALKEAFKGTNIRLDKIRRSLDSLMVQYASANRGVWIEEVNGGYQLRTKIDNLKFIKRMIKGRAFRLSGPSLETLAIVAYKQPVIKMQIDEIRGVESGHLLRVLMEKGLVKFAGKSDLPGKPMLYGTTKKFLETFGLRSINELPSLSEIDELLPEGIGEESEQEKVTLAHITANMSEQVGMSYTQGEEQLQKIADELSQISFTTEFFEEEKKRMREQRDKDRAQNIHEAQAVGEVVDEKDLKWLIRYEAAQRGEAVVAENEEVSETVQQMTDEENVLEEAIRHFDEDSDQPISIDVVDTTNLKPSEPSEPEISL